MSKNSVILIGHTNAWHYPGGSMNKCALITGITGQDGAILAEILRATKFTVCVRIVLYMMRGV